MKIAVMGAGGIGGYVGGRLVQVGEDVQFVARGAHLAALRQAGLRIESPHGNAHLPTVRATDDPARIGAVDVVLFTVKLGATAAAAVLLEPLIGNETRVVTLQNGIDSREMVARHVARERIAIGCIYISARIRVPGVISSPGGARRLVVDGLGGDRVISALVAACNRAPGLEASATDAITPVVWEKFITFTAFSGITCVTRRPIGAVLEHPETVGFLRQLLEENVAVAGAVGVVLAPKTPERILEFFRGQPHETKSSMLVDLEAGKPLEMRWLARRIVELGQAHGVSTPANAAVMAALAPHARGHG